jgi:hypothetical protein
VLLVTSRVFHEHVGINLIAAYLFNKFTAPVEPEDALHVEKGTLNDPSHPLSSYYSSKIRFAVALPSALRHHKCTLRRARICAVVLEVLGT